MLMGTDGPSTARSPEPVAASPGPSPRRRWLLRVGGRVVLYGLLAIVALLVFALFRPWSLEMIDRRIEAGWAAKTGTHLFIERSTLRFSEGVLEIESPRLADPSTGEMLLELRRAKIEFYPGDLLRLRSPLPIHRIILTTGPSPIEMTLKDGRLAPLPPWDHRLEWVQRWQAKTRSGKSRIALDTIVIDHLGLTVYTDVGGERTVLGEVRDGALTFDFDARMALERIGLRGKFCERDRSREVRLTARPDLTRNRGNFTLRFDHFDSVSDLPWPWLVAAQAERFSLVGMIERVPKGWHILASVSAEALTMSGEVIFGRHELGSVSADWDFVVSDELRFEVGKMDLRSDICNLSGHGEFSMRKPFPYRLVIDRLDPGPAGLALMAERLTTKRMRVDTATAQLTIEAEMEGDLSRAIPRRIEGRVDGAGFLIHPHWLPAPLSDIRLSARLTTDTLHVERAGAEFQDVPLAIEGTIRGDPFEPRVDRLDLVWGTLGDMESRSDMTYEWITRDGHSIEIGGKLNGNGRLRLTDPLKGTIRDALEQARLDGQVELMDAWLRDPRLPAPIQEIQGKLIVDSQRVKAEGVAFAYEDLRVKLDGTCEGKDHFWLESAFEGRIRLNGDLKGLEDLKGLLPQSGTASSEPFPSINGQASVDLRVNIPLALWSHARVEGTVELEQGRLAHPRLPEPIEELTLKAKMTSRELEVERLAARWLGQQFDARGRVSGELHFWRDPNIDAHLDVKGPLGVLDRHLRSHGAMLGLHTEKWPPLDGAASIGLDYQGALGAWEAASWKVSLAVDDFSTSVSTPHLRGPVRMDRLRAVLDPRRIELASTRGGLGESAFELEGWFGVDGADFKLGLDGELGKLKRRLPTLFQWWHVAGRASIREHVNLRRVEHVGPKETLAEIWRKTLADPAGADPRWRERLAAMWDAKIDGSVELDGAELTHNVMPTRLRGISGRLENTQQRLWSPQPVTLEAGLGTVGARGMIEFDLGADDRPPSVEIDIGAPHVNLSEWIQKWKPLRPSTGPRKKHHPDVRFDPEAQPDFRFQLEFRGETAEFKEFRGEELSGRLDYRFYRGGPARLGWDDIRCSIYGGAMSLSGSLFNWVLANELELEKVSLPELVRATMSEEKFSGLFSGQVSGRLEIEDILGDPANLAKGEGRFVVENSRFVSNKFFGSLFGVIKLPILEEISFSRIEAPFQIGAGMFTTDELIFDHPVMNLKLTGSVGPGDRVDLDGRLQFLRVVRQVPLVGWGMSLLNRLAGQVLNFKVRGTTTAPEVQVLGR